MKGKINKDDILKKLLVQDGKVYLKEDDHLEFLEDYDKIFSNDRRELSPELQFKINEHGKLCDGLKNLYATKNADYGDSMHPLFEEYGLTAFLVLFGTKINRVKTLMNKDSKQNYESLEDSLLDLANYALIAVTELRADKLNEVGISNVSEDEYREMQHNSTAPYYDVSVIKDNSFTIEGKSNN